MRDEMFAVRLSREERVAITNLAERLQRNESDTMRLVIRELASLFPDPNQQTPSPDEQEAAGV